MPTRAPVHGKAKLTRTDQADILSIETTTAKGKTLTRQYIVERLDPDPEIGYPALHLIRLKDGTPDGVIYNLILRPHGAECDCDDFLWCRDHKDAAG